MKNEEKIVEGKRKRENQKMEDQKSRIKSYNSENSNQRSKIKTQNSKIKSHRLVRR